MKFFLVSLLVISLVALMRDGRVHNASILRYPYFWIVLFSAFYLIIPAIFIDEISDVYRWSLSRESILISRLGSAYWGTVFILFYFVFRKEVRPIEAYATPGQTASKVGTIMLIMLTAWLLWVAVTQAGTVLNQTVAEGYVGNVELGDDNKIKNVAYLFIPLICMMTIKGRYLPWLIGTLLIMFIDVAQGARTTAFIVLVSAYLAIALSKQRMYAITIALVGSIVYSVGIFLRPEELLRIDTVPAHLSLLGEFRETFIPLPYVITHNIYFHVDFSDVFVSFISPLLGPFRGVISWLSVNPGDLVAKAIGKGYGLGFNALYESYYYGDYVGMLVEPWIICGASYLCLKLMRRETWAGLTFAVLFVIFSRLTFREGFVANSGLFIYMAIILTAIPFLLKKIVVANAARSQ